MSISQSTTKMTITKMTTVHKTTITKTASKKRKTTVKTISTNPEKATKQLLQIFKELELGGEYKSHGDKDKHKYYACHTQNGSNAMNNAAFFIEDHNNGGAS